MANNNLFSQRLRAFQSLPRPIQNYLLSLELVNLIEENLVKVFRLNPSQHYALNYIILSIFIGRLSPERALIDEIAKRLDIERSAAVEIAGKIKRLLLPKFKGFIRDLYQRGKNFDKVIKGYKAMNSQPPQKDEFAEKM